MLKGKTILVAPLDWGMGHATRCVPIIRQLIQDNTVLLGVTKVSKVIFDEEFPQLKQVELPSYQIEYSSVLPLWLKLALDSPRIAGIVLQENKALEKIIEEHKIDVVVSDNRFGLYNSKVHSIFITHQLFLKTPIFNLPAQVINKNYILKFDEVWVPDLEDESESLSGALSHGDHYHKNVKYIGPQSRLKDCKTESPLKKYDILILLSGPEPLRTDLEKLLIQNFSESDKKIALARGVLRDRDKGSLRKEAVGNMDMFDIPEKEKLKGLILNSERIICRSGYSTLMDMYALEKTNLMLIPTPGQTEQEYLAGYWWQKFGAKYLHQHELHKLRGT